MPPQPAARQANPTTQNEKAAPEFLGGCFVVWANDGQFWDGSGWVSNWRDAIQFAGAGDPYAECKRVALALDVQAHVGYVPAARRKSRAARSRG